MHRKQHPEHLWKLHFTWGGRENEMETAKEKEKRKIMPAGGGGGATWCDSLNCIMNIDKFYCVVPGARRGREAGAAGLGVATLFLCMHI